MGAGLWSCAVATLVGAAVSRRRRVRVAALLVAGLCVIGVFLTLTRTIWVAAAASALLTLGITPGLRRYLVPVTVTCGLLVAGAWFTIPGLASQARTRESAQASIWDRQNSNAAALRMLKARPLVGFGWNSFKEASPPYYRQAFGYPLTAVGEVHNVFLSNLAELGLIGTSLWLVALVMAVGVPLIRPPPLGLRPWRVGLLAIAIMWVVVAFFDPLPYVFPNLLLWTWCGILWAPLLGSSAE
jgi:O-antigen ligase